MPPISGPNAQRNHQRAPEVALPGSQACVVQQPDAEGQQHRRDRHVGNPHRDQRADDEKAEQRRDRCACRPAAARGTMSRVPRPDCVNACRENQDADEEGDDRVAKAGAHDRAEVGDAECRNQQDDEQRRGGERQRLRSPRA